jgi:hypothetical protein
MAPTVAAVTTANRKATLRLKIATNQLELHLLPQDDLEADETPVSEAPSTKPRSGQPNEFVLRQCMAAMDEKLDALCETVSILVPLLDKRGRRTTRTISLGGPTTARD